ncbi:MAG: family 16 glycoside hydrolase [Saprospiraceae bacterium]
MKKYQFILTSVFILLTISCFSQGPMKMDLQKLYKENGIEVYNRELTLINEKSYPGIRLSKDYGEGIAWLKNIDFSNGTLEFDVRGEDVKKHSFVGIAFHAQNDSTFEAIYLRPFQFKSTDETLRSHSIQYISLPKFTWQVLRANSPGKFEQPIDPSPDPNSWVRIRIVINDATISTYINGEKEPSLVVEKFTPFTHGAVGFYVADTSGGDFANITITKTE